MAKRGRPKKVQSQPQAQSAVKETTTAPEIFIMNKNKQKDNSPSRFLPFEKKRRINRFVDNPKTMEVADLKVIGTQTQVPRGEARAEKITATCSICGEEVQVSSSLVFNEILFKCNDCCTKTGRRKLKKKLEE